MASIDFAAGRNADDILMFGRYCQAMLAMEPGSIDDTKPLSHEEAAYISGTAAYDDATVAMICRERLDLGIDYYYAVKQQITSLLRAWDAVLDEKRRYDTVGWLERSRTFMDSFQLCSYLIPQRTSLGFSEPVRAPHLEPHGTSPALSPQPSYYSATSTVVNSPTAWAGHETSTYGSGYGEGSLAINDGYPEGHAISPTVSDGSFEHGDLEGGGAGVILIPSDYGASESEYSYQSSDSDDSEQSEVPNPPKKSKSGSGPKAGLEDAPWEILLNDPLRARQPYREEIRRDEGFGSRQPVANKRKARSLDLEESAPRKKQALAGHHSGSQSRDGAGSGGKRTRTRSRPSTV